jgi:Ca2+-binding RTX toxin-like protein
MVGEISIRVGEPVSDKVSGDMFSYNYLSRLDKATPDSLYSKALQLILGTGIRYPGGTITEQSFDILNPDRSVDSSGRPVTPFSEFMAMAKLLGVAATIVLPTKIALLDATDAAGNRMVDPDAAVNVYKFVYDAVKLALASGTEIRAFEIGNEYWGSGEMNSVEYGKIANAYAPIIDKAISDAQGYPNNGETKIIAQMGATWNDDLTGITSSSPASVLQKYGLNASDFDSSGQLTWQAKQVVANLDILSQLSPAAKASITGLVEHFYLGSGEDILKFDTSTLKFIDLDISIWAANGMGDKDLYITEWNVDTANTGQLGLKGAGAVLFQFACMMRLGVDAAFAWALKHNTTTDLAGSPNATPVLSASGALLNHMADNVIGKQLIEVTDSRGDMVLYAFAGPGEVVLYIVSRGTDDTSVSLDFGTMFPGSTLKDVDVLGFDPASSDGFHRIGSTGFTVPGYLEHDTVGLVTDVAVASNQSTLQVALEPYEITMIVLEVPIGSGTSGADHLTGTISADKIAAFGGNDTILASAGNDIVDGGTGFDVFQANQNSNFTIDLTLGKAQSSLTGRDALQSIEGVSTSAGNDMIIGSSVDNVLRSRAGNDVVAGLAGNDTIDAGAGRDVVDGGVGVDTLILTSKVGLRFNLARKDVQTVEFGTVRAVGFENLVGGAGSDVLFGSSTNNAISGMSGNDTLSGCGGNDTLNGGRGDDFLFGGLGNDFLRGLDNRDSLYGGAGNDTLCGEAESDRLFGDAGQDSLIGGIGADFLSGGTGNDRLLGNLGRDRLYGGDGDDFLTGGTGDDWLNPGFGRDTMVGGAGADTFVFQRGNGNGRVGDFEIGEDKIAMPRDVYQDLVFTDASTGVFLKSGTDSWFLNGISSASLSESDFLFI